MCNPPARDGWCTHRTFSLLTTLLAAQRSNNTKQSNAIAKPTMVLDWAHCLAQRVAAELRELAWMTRQLPCAMPSITQNTIRWSRCCTRRARRSGRTWTRTWVARALQFHLARVRPSTLVEAALSCVRATPSSPTSASSSTRCYAHILLTALRRGGTTSQTKAASAVHAARSNSETRRGR